MRTERGRRTMGARWAKWVALVAVMVAPGCTRLPASAVRQIGESHRAYQAGRYAQAQRLVTPVIAKHPDKPDVAEALYVRGLSRLKTGKTVTARGDFESALGVADRDELIALLHAQLGNLDYETQLARKRGIHIELPQHVRRMLAGLSTLMAALGRDPGRRRYRCADHWQTARFAETW